MITGSKLVFSNVPACQLDPFLMAEGRISGEEGFVVISYPEGCHDLLFLRGKEIRIATHLRPEYRFPLQPDAVRDRYRRYRSDSRTVLSFYLSPSDSIRRFLSTFYYKSFLNIELDLLGRRQRQVLAAKTEGEQWLVELDRSPLARTSTASSLVPSIEIQEVRKREELQSLLTGMTSGRLILYDLERNLEMLRMKTQCATIHSPAGDGTSSASGEARGPAGSPVAGADREEDRRSSMAPPAPRIELAGPVRHPERGCERHFDILFRRFRKQASQLLGMKYHALEAKAEKEVQASEPGFRLERLSGESATLVLQVIQIIAKKAPILKRSHIRCMTITLVAEFYSAHYEVLEQNNVLTAVEDFYRKLKS
ncbi:MAG: hypothetical protein WBG80_00910 [Bacteroidota bacterium]